MKRALYFTFLLLVITSCEREEKITYPIKYTSSAKPINISFRVFTADGEITDESVIESIVRRKNLRFNDLENIDLTDYLKVEYLSPEKVIIEIADRLEDDERNVIIDNNSIYWEKQEETSVSFSVTDFHKYHKYLPLQYEEFLVASGANFLNTHTKYNHCYFAEINNGKITFPIMDFRIIEYTSSSGNSGLNNKIDIEKLNQLSDRDTIVFQEFSLELK